MLPALLLLAGAIRCWQLGSHGLLLLDEGVLHFEAASVLSLVTGTGPDGLPADPAALATVRLGRFAHNVLLAGVLAVRPGHAAGPLLSAVAGTAAVGLVWLIGARLRGRAEAALTAVLLACSPFAVAYSRSGLSDSLATMWSLASLAALLHALPAARTRRPGGARGPALAALAGWCASCAFLTSDRYVHALLLLPMAARLAGAPLRAWWPAALAGAAAPLVAGELAERHWAALAGPRVFPAGALFSQVAFFFREHAGQGFTPRGGHALLAYLGADEGWVSATWAAAALGWLALARGGSRREWAVRLWWLLPLLLWSVYWTKCHRFFCHAVPFLTLLKVEALFAAAGRLRLRTRTTMAVGLVLAAASLPSLREELVTRNPYGVALERLVSPAPRHLSSNVAVGGAMTARGRCELVPASGAELDDRIASGFRVLVTDLQLWFGGVPDSRLRLDVLARIRNTVPPAAEIPYPPRALRFFVFNQCLPWDVAHRAVPAVHGAGPPPAVRIYVLAGPRGASVRP